MPAKRKRWTTSARVAFFAAVVAWPIATACSGGSTAAPAGSGDDVINDTRDAQPNPVNPDPGDDAGPDADNTGPTYYSEGGTYPGTVECSSCTCPVYTNYCFGGATARTEIAGFTPLASDAGKATADAGKSTGGGGDGGLPMCAIVDASTPELGCNAMPPGCADCDCVLTKLQPLYSCYLVCASNGAGTPITVYCPHM